MARGVGSLAWTFLTGMFSFGFVGLLWALFDDEFADFLMSQNAWQTGSDAALLARHWIQLGWTWMPLIVLLGIGVEALISARLVGRSSSNIIVRSFGLFIVHVFMVFWGFVFPEMIDPLFEVAANQQALDGSTMTQALPWYEEVLFAYLPGLVLVGADIFYIVAPIRDDVQGGVSYA